MVVLLVAIAVAGGLIAAYRIYGRWLARAVFRLDDSAVTPAIEHGDGQDYVATPLPILFGHHFTSIAGTGPIVGPAVAVVWGWGPALLWVVFGSIFIGAVHDFGSLVVSIRRGGQTIGQIAGQVIHPRVRVLFSSVLILALTIVLAIFGLVIAAVFKAYPSAIAPCLFQIPIAVLVGVVFRRRWTGLLLPSIVALAGMYVAVIYGDAGILGRLNDWAASLPILVWVMVLLAYAYVASVLPVSWLLQPRDYINALQLAVAIGLVVAGLVAAALFGGAAIDTPAGAPRTTLTFAAPWFRGSVADAPALFPFLFVTVACGACSGFHCLVSSGTSSKQLARQSDALPIGFGSMLGEAFLATIVILACVAGLGLGVTDGDGTFLTGEAAYLSKYPAWGGGAGLSDKLSGFVAGSANFLHSIGVPGGAAVAIIGVLVASFAGTTMDSACRLQRYVIQEFVGGAATATPRSGGVRGALANKHVATLTAVTVAWGIAAIPGGATEMSIAEAIRSGTLGQWLLAYGGTGGMILWPLFGATNQLLAGVALMVIAFSLWRRGLPVWFVALPAGLMLLVPIVAMSMLLRQTWGAPSGSWAVLAVGAATMGLQVWMVVEAALVWGKMRRSVDGPGRGQSAATR